MGISIKKLLALGLFAFSLASCGIEAGNYAYLPDSLEYDLTANLEKSVWHDTEKIVNSSTGNKTVYVEELQLLEDGRYYEDVIIASFLDDSKDEIYGIYQVDFLDADEISFTTSIGFPFLEDHSDEFVFNLSIQEGDEFITLSDTTVKYSGDLKNVSVDLSRYRGRNKFLIISSKNINSGNLSFVLIKPKITYRYY